MLELEQELVAMWQLVNELSGEPDRFLHFGPRDVTEGVTFWMNRAVGQ
jgi:hypothetical protein